jgi:hypothetical protein
MTYALKILMVVVLANYFVACKPAKITNKKEFMKYLSDSKNGLVKDKKVGYIYYKLKYLPEDFGSG